MNHTDVIHVLWTSMNMSSFVFMIKVSISFFCSNHSAYVLCTHKKTSFGELICGGAHLFIAILFPTFLFFSKLPAFPDGQHAAGRYSDHRGRSASPPAATPVRPVVLQLPRRRSLHGRRDSAVGQRAAQPEWRVGVFVSSSSSRFKNGRMNECHLAAEFQSNFISLCECVTAVWL